MVFSSSLPGLFFCRVFRVFAVLLLSVSLFSVFVVAQNTPTSASPGSVAQCVGADYSKLDSHATYGKCSRFRNEISAAAEKNGLFAEGVDLAQIFTIGLIESGCTTGEEMRAKGGRLERVGWGGFFQVDNPCLFKHECPTFDLEVDEGTKEMVNTVRAVKRLGFSGKDANLMYLFAYNRGIGAVQKVKENMNKGMSMPQAVDEACAYYYGYPDGRCGAIRCSSAMRCNPERTCVSNFDFYCNKAKGSVGIQYAGASWDNFVKICTAAGGTVNENGGSVVVASTDGGAGSGGGIVPASVPRGEEAPRASGSTAGVARRQHPLFAVPYSINPSFRSSVPFDFNIYASIGAQLKKLNFCDGDEVCVAENVTSFEHESQGSMDWMAKSGGNVITKEVSGPLVGKSELLKWEAFCEPENQDAVNSLAEAIDLCASSKDKECVCPLEYPIVPPTDKESWLGVAANALSFGLISSTTSAVDVAWTKRKLNLQVAGANTTVRLVEPSDSKVKAVLVRGIAVSVDQPSLSFLDSILSGVGLIEEARADTFVYTPDFQGKVAVIYKTDVNKGTLYYDVADAPTDKRCEVFNKYMKFCVKQEGTFVAYDAGTDNVDQRKVVVKFAYYFAPPVGDVGSISVFDAKLSERSLFIVWDAVEGSDVSKYTLYYSPDSSLRVTLKDKTVEDINADADLSSRLSKVEFDSAYAEEVPLFDYSQDPLCLVAGLSCQVSYLSQALLTPVPLYHNFLYVMSQSEPKKYLVILDDVEDGTKYFFGMTATDSQGVESKSLTVPDESKVQASKDDLPPGLAYFTVSGDPSVGLAFNVDPIVQNIDGTDLLDVSLVTQYKVYCFRDNEDVFDLSKKTPFKTEAVVSPGSPQEIRTDAVPAACMTDASAEQSSPPMFVITGVDDKNNEFRGTLDRSALIGISS
jgi:hypothetical protein